MGLNAIGFTIYSLPADPQRRVEYCRDDRTGIVARVTAIGLHLRCVISQCLAVLLKSDDCFAIRTWRK